MTSRDFCYWLQGYFEIAGTKELTALQALIVQKHLNLVFKHEIDPSMGDAKHQAELNAIHNKPTLQELGEKHGFPVHEGNFGPSPGEGYVLDILHGWHKKDELLRC